MLSGPRDLLFHFGGDGKCANSRQFPVTVTETCSFRNHSSGLTKISECNSLLQLRIPPPAFDFESIDSPGQQEPGTANLSSFKPENPLTGLAFPSHPPQFHPIKLLLLGTITGQQEVVACFGLLGLSRFFAP
ncbi:MAG: hypothetical protein ACI9R3_001279 [Verrucomicrobiales bacterium]|jgi:hypothetical protein